MECTLKIKLGGLEIVRAFDSIFRPLLERFLRKYTVTLKCLNRETVLHVWMQLKWSIIIHVFLLCTKSCNMTSSEICMHEHAVILSHDFNSTFCLPPTDLLC